MPTLMEIIVALAIIVILVSYDWVTFPPAMCAQTVVRTAWGAFWFWWSTGCR